MGFGILRIPPSRVKMSVLGAWHGMPSFTSLTHTSRQKKEETAEEDDELELFVSYHTEAISNDKLENLSVV